jgi:hypothetical protein
MPNGRQFGTHWIQENGAIPGKAEHAAYQKGPLNPHGYESFPKDSQ